MVHVSIWTEHPLFWMHLDHAWTCICQCIYCGSTICWGSLAPKMLHVSVMDILYWRKINIYGALCNGCSWFIVAASRFKLGCFSSPQWGRALVWAVWKASGGLYVSLRCWLSAAWWRSSPANIAHQQPQGDDHIGRVSTDLLHHLSSSSSVSVTLSAARRPDWTRRCQEDETLVISAQKGLSVWSVMSL